jgi:hypothetical protein
MHSTLGRRRLAGAAIAATAALAAWAPTAPAEDAPAPVAPTPCDENVISDVAGDSYYWQTPVAFNTEPDRQPGTPNLDIRKVFFTYAPGADGKKQLRANLVIEKLDKTVPDVAYASTVNYQVTWETADGRLYNARAKQDGTDWSYDLEIFEPVDPLPLRLNGTEETTGKAIEGPNGVVSIDIPAEAVPGLAVGMPFEGVSGSTFVSDQTEFTASSDSAPDEGDPPTIAVPDCQPPVAKSDETKDEVKDEVKEEVKTETKTETAAPPAPPAPPAESASVAPAPAPVAAPAKPVVKKKAASKAKKCKAKKGKGRKARAKACKTKKKSKARARRRSR